MKKINGLIALIFLAAFYSGIYAQEPPPVTGDKNLRDTDIKMRSVDMERVERDAKKTDKTPANSKSTKEDKLAAKYEEIKTDYEQLQLSQDAVVKAYQEGGNIDFAKIADSAEAVNKSAARLDSNLFSFTYAENPVAKKKKEDETEKEIKPVSKSVKDLIVELDNTIGSFVTSPMFQNLRTVDAEASKKAKLELEKIIALSALLSAEARKMQTGSK